MYIRRETLTVTTTTAASVVRYTPTVNGELHTVQYVRSTAAPLSSTATVAVATEGSARTILSKAIGGASFDNHPRIVNFVNSTGGDVSLLGSTGNGAHLDKMIVANERISLTVAASSAAGQVGTFYIDVIGGSG